MSVFSYKLSISIDSREKTKNRSRLSGTLCASNVSALGSALVAVYAAGCPAFAAAWCWLHRCSWTTVVTAAPSDFSAAPHRLHCQARAQLTRSRPSSTSHRHASCVRRARRIGVRVEPGAASLCAAHRGTPCARQRRRVRRWSEK